MKLANYRSPTPDDLQFIMSSWLHSNRNSDFANYINNDTYYKLHEPLIKVLIAASMVTMICDKEDPSHVYGYAVYELPNDKLILHYIYIKFNYRNMGLAKQCLQTIYPLFGETDCYLTHIDRTMTRVSQDSITKEPLVKRNSAFIKKREKYKLNYNPYLMIRN
jgi:hypothetical protein